jgi:nicotinate-nucleotide pyrophosphorylase (carboxylating)
MTQTLRDILILPIIKAALAEDLGLAGDVTADACVPPNARLDCVFATREAGIVSGLACARLALHELDPDATFKAIAHDGQAVEAGARLARITGSARAVLSSERTALNLLGRLSGIATLTRAYVDAVADTKVRITDTRKTTPGLRALEKYAVRCGGGVNHRFGLDDAILIKDNHIAACGSVAEAIRRSKAAAGHLMKVEVEVDTLEQFEEALAAKPDVIMLDNFNLKNMAKAVKLANGRVTLEASGGVTLERVAKIAATGVDVISVGALTHSAKVLDIGLDVR